MSCYWIGISFIWPRIAIRVENIRPIIIIINYVLVPVHIEPEKGTELTKEENWQALPTYTRYGVCVWAGSSVYYALLTLSYFFSSVHMTITEQVNWMHLDHKSFDKSPISTVMGWRKLRTSWVIFRIMENSFLPKIHFPTAKKSKWIKCRP